MGGQLGHDDGRVRAGRDAHDVPDDPHDARDKRDRRLQPRVTTTAAALRVDVITDLADLERLADRWAMLLAATAATPGVPGGCVTPFAGPAFVLTWFRHFERPGGIYAVTVWQGDDLVGIAPFARTRLGRPAAATLLVSAGVEQGAYGDPLLGPNPAPVATAIADHLATVVRRRTVVNVRRLRAESLLLAALETHDGLLAAPMGQLDETAVMRFDCIDDPAAHLRRKGRRYDIDRRLRRLADAHGEVAFVPAEPDVDDALDDMREMLLRRWGPDAGPRVLRDPRVELFTRDAMRALAAEGHARVASLTAGGRRIAVSTALQLGDRQIGDNIAFDPEFAAFSAGQAQVLLELRHAHASGAVEYDMRAGDYPYKQHWANAAHRTRSVWLRAPGPAGAGMQAARRAAMSLRARRLAQR